MSLLLSLPRLRRCGLDFRVDPLELQKALDCENERARTLDRIHVEIMRQDRPRAKASWDGKYYWIRRGKDVLHLWGQR